MASPSGGLEILYRDDRYIAVDKPSGLFVHPTVLGRREPSVLPLLRDQIGQLLYPVHRLDRATSGVLLFALDPQAARRMAELFAGRRVAKRYLAVVRGYTEPQGRVELPLRERGGTAVQEARTDYRRLATVELDTPVGPHPKARYSLVEAEPRTGRRHQIRRHFARIAHPIVGDTRYGDTAHNVLFREAFGSRRLLLLASELAFDHPFTGAPLAIRAPLPPEVQELFGRLGWAEAGPGR